MEESFGNLYIRDRTESEDDVNSENNGSPSKSSSVSSLRNIRDTFKRSESRSSQSSTVGAHAAPESPKKSSRDSAAIERSNLVNICKSIVKELLEQSLRFGRIVDSDNIPQEHFFTVLEHILRHGLKSKKGLLGPKKDIWEILQCVDKYCMEAHDITSSVRELPNVRTPIGRARAWLRIALMQKKLSDYMQVLIQHRNKLLTDFYEPHALMMMEEVITIKINMIRIFTID